MKRLLVVACALLSFAQLTTVVRAAGEPDPEDWNAVLNAAEGQTVYWHAWAGSSRINDYIAWVGGEVEQRYGVELIHVKLSDTAEAVSRVLSEKAAGRDEEGAVDLIWMNGENFADMKRRQLLFGPWAEQLPNWRYVDLEDGPPIRSDFTVPTEGLEAPWGSARVVFYYDSARLADPPRSMGALLEWAKQHPGRFTFPQPPDFLGSTFLKQALYELTPDPAVLTRPAEEGDYRVATAPLWQFMEELTPRLWRKGRAYPQSGRRQIQLMADGEIDLAISFSPSEASAAIANFELPESVRTFVLDAGTIGNTSFVAIPYNARAKAGAMVVANFLLSPIAQARKQDPAHWGSGTVLDLDELDPVDRRRFDSIDPGVATLRPDELGRTLSEPHPSWVVRLEKEWIERFGIAR